MTEEHLNPQFDSSLPDRPEAVDSSQKSSLSPLGELETVFSNQISESHVDELLAEVLFFEAMSTPAETESFTAKFNEALQGQTQRALAQTSRTETAEFDQSVSASQEVGIPAGHSIYGTVSGLLGVLIIIFVVLSFARLDLDIQIAPEADQKGATTTEAQDVNSILRHHKRRLKVEAEEIAALQKWLIDSGFHHKIRGHTVIANQNIDKPRRHHRVIQIRKRIRRSPSNSLEQSDPALEQEIVESMTLSGIGDGKSMAAKLSARRKKPDDRSRAAQALVSDDSQNQMWVDRQDHHLASYTADRTPIATWNNLTEANWGDHSPPAKMKRGTYKLKSGKVKLSIINGASFEVSGPSKFELLSPELVMIFEGKIRSMASSSKNLPAIPLSLYTPISKLNANNAEIDLLVLEDGTTDLSVANGLVSVSTRTEDGRRWRLGPTANKAIFYSTPSNSRVAVVLPPSKSQARGFIDFGPEFIPFDNLTEFEAAHVKLLDSLADMKDDFNKLASSNAKARRHESGALPHKPHDQIEAQALAIIRREIVSNSSSKIFVRPFSIKSKNFDIETLKIFEELDLSSNGNTSRQLASASEIEVELQLDSTNRDPRSRSSLKIFIGTVEFEFQSVADLEEQLVEFRASFDSNTN